MKNLFLVLALLSTFYCYSQQDSNQNFKVVLPLQITDFVANGISKNVQLSWIVNSNEDAKGFEIERVNSDSTFTTIGGRLSSGKTGTTSYEFVDALPKRNIPLSYRIKIIAKDGSTVYSNLQEAKIEEDELKIKLRKNPVLQAIDLELISPQATIVQAFVFSNNGQKTISETMKVSAGVNNLSLSAQNLLPGIHRLVLQMGNERKVFSFVKE